MLKLDLINAIKEYISKNGGFYPDWYVGITSDPESRVFSGHNVNKQSGVWVHGPASSSQEAREVENYFISTIGTDGGSGGGDFTSTT
ncbi:MAG: hypothetical protein NTY22_05970, partial [Proteobacteria bacterium]|nr:hypothetical protein [Pseudomonadota bacterium]